MLLLTVDIIKRHDILDWLEFVFVGTQRNWENKPKLFFSKQQNLNINFMQSHSQSHCKNHNNSKNSNNNRITNQSFKGQFNSKQNYCVTWKISKFHQLETIFKFTCAAVNIEYCLDNKEVHITSNRKCCCWCCNEQQHCIISSSYLACHPVNAHVQSNLSEFRYALSIHYCC